MFAVYLGRGIEHPSGAYGFQWVHSREKSKDPEEVDIRKKGGCMENLYRAACFKVRVHIGCPCLPRAWRNRTVNAGGVVLVERAW